jgi:hypothetical protein
MTTFKIILRTALKALWRRHQLLCLEAREVKDHL